MKKDCDYCFGLSWAGCRLAAAATFVPLSAASHHVGLWAPVGMGMGAIAPWKCCKLFCALVVTVKRSVDQLFMHYFHDFLEDLSGLCSDFCLCFEGDDSKRSQVKNDDSIDNI